MVLLLLLTAMSVGKNKKLSKGRKGGKKKMCVGGMGCFYRNSQQMRHASEERSEGRNRSLGIF